MVSNPYQVLGVEPTADIKEIKKAYRRLAKVYHPDSPSGNKDKFIQLQEAWEIVNSQKEVVNTIKRGFVTHKSLFKFRRI